MKAPAVDGEGLRDIGPGHFPPSAANLPPVLALKIFHNIDSAIQS